MGDQNRCEDDQPETGHILRLKDDDLSCLWRGSCKPTPSLVRFLIDRWMEKMPEAIGEILIGVEAPESEVVVHLLILVAFIRWYESEARRIAAIKEQEEQQKASRDF